MACVGKFRRAKSSADLEQLKKEIKDCQWGMVVDQRRIKRNEAAISRLRKKLDKPSLSMEEKETLEDEMESKEFEIKLCKKNIVSFEQEVKQYEKQMQVDCNDMCCDLVPCRNS